MGSGVFCRHLQMAALLEAWTIPYYMAAMFSIVDRASPAYQLIQSVVNQEMLHLQLVANVANAYGYLPSRTRMFSVHDEQIPYLDFDLTPHPYVATVSNFTPDNTTLAPRSDRSTDSGSTPCAFRIPWLADRSQPEFRDDLTEYDSIGEFYDALQYGAELLGLGHRRGEETGRHVLGLLPPLRE